MSLATDHVSFSPKPDHWNIRALVIIGLFLAAAWLVFAFGVLLIGKYLLTLPLAPLQTLVLVMLVFSGQANMYSVRERHHFWHSRPSRWLMLSTALDVLIVSWFALQGWLMTSIGFGLITGLFGATIAYMVALDFLKIRVFRRFLNDERTVL